MKSLQEELRSSQELYQVVLTSNIAMRQQLAQFDPPPAAQGLSRHQYHHPKLGWLACDISCSTEGEDTEAPFVQAQLHAAFLCGRNVLDFLPDTDIVLIEQDFLSKKAA